MKKSALLAGMVSLGASVQAATVVRIPAPVAQVSHVVSGSTMASMVAAVRALENEVRALRQEVRSRDTRVYTPDYAEVRKVAKQFAQNAPLSQVLAARHEWQERSGRYAPSTPDHLVCAIWIAELSQ